MFNDLSAHRAIFLPAARVFTCMIAVFLSLSVQAQTIIIDTSPTGRQQVIDGFGAHQGNADRDQPWWQELYFDDLMSSIYRIDLTPRFIYPYSDQQYNSPNWNNPGPEGNYVRTYTNVSDYSRVFDGRRAQIAVMGPNIDENIKYFDYAENGAVRAGLARKEQLGDFKLVGSLWSPAPWVKVASGNHYNGPLWAQSPKEGTPWPFIWLGNFAGGKLDVSGTPLPEFDDSALGGTGPTSALTQFARGIAAYLRGFQNKFGIPFYAISIQNEVNFEEFYNSCTYPLSSQYIAALKAVRAELDRYSDLKEIRIMGPEDLMGGDVWGMWQYGSGNSVIHKNLQYLRNIATDPEANQAIDFFCIHGYDSDGVSSAGADVTLWNWWANGWTNSPHSAIPDNVSGFQSYGKKSWMTETSGEQAEWLEPKNGFPNRGAWSIALKIHQALTVGNQSAWIYWTFSEEENGTVTPFALTSRREGNLAPKYVAAKHFFRYIRPGAQRLSTTISSTTSISASAYVHDTQGTLVIVLVNSSPEAQLATLQVPSNTAGRITSFEAFTSSEGKLWQESEISVENNQANIPLPGYGVVTLKGVGVPVEIEDDPAELSSETGLFENYPEPFTQSTLITYRLSDLVRVQLTVFDATGKERMTLVNEVKPAGTYTVDFNASGLSNGVYFVRFTAGNIRDAITLVIMK